MFLSVLLLITIIIYNLYISSTRFTNEPFTNKNTTIILLGDSILKNNRYVNPTYSVEYLLQEQSIQGQSIQGQSKPGQSIPGQSKLVLYGLAKDGAGIKDVYAQLKNLPDRLNGTDSAIFLSAGGNDLLQNNSNIDNLFQDYEQLLTTLKQRFNKCKLNIMNLYIPPSIQTNQVLRNKIVQWNNKLKTYALQNNIHLIPLDTLLYEPVDFVDNYEPSEMGGVKIVKAIMLTL